MITPIMSGYVQATKLSELEYLTESYPPYSYFQEGKLQGIAVDLLNASLASVGESIDISNIKILPWARSYRMTRLGKNKVLFPMTRTLSRENIFSWVGPITISRTVLFSHKKSGVVINDLDSLEKFSIGVIREDVGEHILLSSGVNKEILVRLDSPVQSFKMLTLNRINLFSYNETVGRWFIKEAGLNVDDFKVSHTLQAVS